MKLRFLVCAALLAAGVLILSGCGSDSVTAPTGPAFDDPNATEPTAGTWKTYVLASPSVYRPAAPPASASQAFKDELAQQKTYMSSRTPNTQARIDYWNGGVARRWNEYQRSLIMHIKPNPPRASRGLALVSMAMYEAMVASYDAKYFYKRPHPSAYDTTIHVYGAVDHSPSYVDEKIAMGRAACDVLAFLFPDSIAEIQARFGDLRTAELQSGNHFQSDVDAAFELGGKVAEAVVSRAGTDNSNAVNSDHSPVGPGYWVPTPPAYQQNPVEPACGLWKPWVLATGATLRPAAPPAVDSHEFILQKQEVYDVSRSLSEERRQIALFWADGGGTVTPPGHWNQIAVDMGVAKGLNEPRMARMLALLGLAQADAFIACWECKYHYWCVRPVTRIDADIDTSWVPLIATPPFPSFPSGHSTTSGAAATVLGYLFPEDAVALRQMAGDAMNSRLYGGIHFSFDNLTGFNLGAGIGSRVTALASRDGAPARPSRQPVATRLFVSSRSSRAPAGASLRNAAD